MASTRLKSYLNQFLPGDRTGESLQLQRCRSHRPLAGGGGLAPPPKTPQNHPCFFPLGLDASTPKHPENNPSHGRPWRMLLDEYLGRARRLGGVLHDL